MHILKWIVGVAVLVLLSSCGSPSNPIDPGGSNNEPEDPTLIASGDIVPFRDADGAEDAAEFGEGAHAVVTLCSMAGMDAPCQTLATQTIEDVDSFPIPFRLEGDPEGVFSQPGAGYYVYYLLSATVYMGEGDDLYIGDFINNVWTELDGPTSDVQLTVDRLEPCGEPHASFGCADTERP
jgi:hypothetical protein